MVVALNSLLLAVQLAATPASYCQLPHAEIVLPTYPAPITISNGYGEPMVKASQPHLQFAQMNLQVAYTDAAARIAWVPLTVEDAAFSLREMLPSEFYSRLLENFNRTNGHLMSPKDLALNERIGDVAGFLKERWNGGWNKQNDGFKILNEIMKYSSALAVSLPSRCENR